MKTASNYPPGVTGLEPEIAGLPEGDEYVECDNDDWLVNPDDEESQPCGYKGYVEGGYSGPTRAPATGGTFEADCPRCGDLIVVELPTQDEIRNPENT